MTKEEGKLLSCKLEVAKRHTENGGKYVLKINNDEAALLSYLLDDFLKNIHSKEKMLGVWNTSLGCNTSCSIE